MSGPFLVLTPAGLRGRTLLVNAAYVVRAEPDSGGGAVLFLVRDSDPDGLRSIRVEESIADIAGALQSRALVGSPQLPPTAQPVSKAAPGEKQTLLSFPVPSFEDAMPKGTE